jgi:hypothetical protein
MNTYLGIIAVEPLPEYSLLLTFEDGQKRIFNVTPYLEKSTFKALNDIYVFQSVRVKFDSIEWNNGADLDPEMLYAESVPADQSILC